MFVLIFFKDFLESVSGRPGRWHVRAVAKPFLGPSVESLAFSQPVVDAPAMGYPSDFACNLFQSGPPTRMKKRKNEIKHEKQLKNNETTLQKCMGINGGSIQKTFFQKLFFF